MRLIDTEQTEKRWFTELHGNFKDDYAKGFQAGLLAVIRQEAIEAEPVRHASWKYYHKKGIAVCTDCSFERNVDDNFGHAVSCPNCGAKMDGKEKME